MKRRNFWKQHFLLGGLLAGILFIPLSCAKEPVEKKVLPKPVEKEVETPYIPPENWDQIRIAVQTALVVFDTDRFEVPLMKAVNKNIRGKVSRKEAEEQINKAIEALLPIWKRKIAKETMDFEMETYKDDEFELMLEETTMRPLVPLIRAYAIGKLKQKGQLKEE